MCSSDLKIASTEAMRLTSTGLGIGTTTINNKLEVGGVIAVQRSTNTARVSTLSNETGNFVIAADANYNMIFNTGGGEKARIDTSGNLGIGTSSPSSSNYSGSATVVNVKGNGTNKIGSFIAQSYGTVNATNIEMFEIGRAHV